MLLQQFERCKHMRNCLCTLLVEPILYIALLNLPHCTTSLYTMSYITSRLYCAGSCANAPQATCPAIAMYPQTGDEHADGLIAPWDGLPSLGRLSSSSFAGVREGWCSQPCSLRHRPLIVYDYSIRTFVWFQGTSELFGPRPIGFEPCLRLQ